MVTVHALSLLPTDSWSQPEYVRGASEVEVAFSPPQVSSDEDTKHRGRVWSTSLCTGKSTSTVLYHCNKFLSNIMVNGQCCYCTAIIYYCTATVVTAVA